MWHTNGDLFLHTRITVLLISHFWIHSVLRHTTWKRWAICGCSAYRMTATLLDKFFVGFRVALEIRLETYGPRHISVVLWYNTVCVHCKPVLYTLLFGRQLRLKTKLTYFMTAYYTPNNNFTANNASFYHNKVRYLVYTLQCPFNWSCTLSLKLLWGTTVPLYKFTAQQPKKEHKLVIKSFL